MSDHDEYDDELESGELYYYPTKDLVSELPDERISPRMVGGFFLPHARVPKKFIEMIRSFSDVEIEGLLTGSIPLMAKRFSKKQIAGGYKLPYDETSLELYGSIGISGDRTVLDAVTGVGSMLEMRDVTLFDVVSSVRGGMDVDFDAMGLNPNMNMSNEAQWYHVRVNELLAHMGLTNSSPNKNTLKDRLDRISKMVFLQKFFISGKKLPNDRNFRIFVDNGVIYLCDLKELDNKKGKAVDTFTDILVGISPEYSLENERDGFLSRSRLHSVYPILNKTKIIDFLKWLDSNTRDFYNNKYLSWAIDRYYDSNADAMVGSNMTKLKGELFKNVVKEADLLSNHFNLQLVKLDSSKVKNPMKRYDYSDYQIVYVSAVDSEDDDSVADWVEIEK
ncbi:hypothetical protein [Photobacterium damselae]|uniref:hypothetical protein n=1 Tax=Photobacterium damselae TaxID=38293 RepID=UPI001F3F3E6C|nr:hypothetical protein [Photobacterium damselae]UKA04740.1 hypothetical protein IHC89_21095 [Photobacterium damselae subsp. damselae]